MDEIILIGSGGHARSCIDVIESTGFYQIAGLVEKSVIQTAENLGYPVIGTDDDLPELRKKYKNALIKVEKFSLFLKEPRQVVSQAFSEPAKFIKLFLESSTDPGYFR